MAKRKAKAETKSCVAYAGDCREILKTINEAGPGWADLIFADPPFNIGKKYDVYRDSRPRREYLDFTREWLVQCHAALSPRGSIWVAIGDAYVHRYRLILEDELGLHFRDHVIWHYTFGQHATRAFARSHTHLLHYVRDRKHFTFNADEVRVPSWRLVNGDKRANPAGRLPDDVWGFSRVCGTFKERVGWHGCQMPEAVLARILRVSSNPGDMVLDPFLGSGTTGAVAKKLNRLFIGIDLSDDYAAKAQARIDEARRDDPIASETVPEPVGPVRASARGRRHRAG